MAGLPAGRFDRRVTIQRRAAKENLDGRTRGEFAPVAGLTNISCAYREISLREIALGNGVQPGIEAEMRLRDCAAARTVTIADRAVIAGQGFDIVGVGLPDARTGQIIIMLRRVKG